MKNKILWVLIVMAIVCSYALIAHGETVTYIRPISQYSVPELVTYFADKYQVSETDMIKVMKCESGGKVVWGDNHHARGVYQYWQPTWDRFSKEFGENLDRESTFDQIKLTAWAFSKNYQNHWTCYQILNNH